MRNRTAAALTIAIIFSHLAGESCLAGPNNLRRTATLYSNGHPVTEEFGRIKSVAATTNGYLFVSFAAFTNFDNTQSIELHTWDVRDPKSPQLIGRLDLRDPGDKEEPFDRSLLAPHDMAVVKDHLVFWRNFELYSYKITSDGSLQQVFKSDFADDLNPDLNRLSIGGFYASSERDLLTNNQFLQLIDVLGYDQAEDLIREHTLINLQNPAEPFLVRETRQYGKHLKVMDPGPTGSLNGLPARFTISDDALTASLLSFSQARSVHFTQFWQPVLRSIFKGRRLSRTLGQLSRAIANAIQPAAFLRRLNNLVLRDLNLPAKVTLSARVSAIYDQQALLSELLDSFGISPDDSLQFALEKIVGSLIDAELEASLKDVVASAVTSQFSTALFGKAPRTVRRLAAELSGAMNSRLKSMGIDKYLLNIVMGPLIDLPAVFRIKLKDLIVQLSESSFGQGVSAALSTFHAVIPIDDILTALFRAANVEVPRCLDLPDDSEQFLRLLLTSGGASLNLNNFAFIEILKLVHHYEGSTDFAALLASLRSQLQTLHLNLSESFATELFKGLDLASALDDRLGAIFSRIEERIDIRPIVAKAISQGVISQLAKDGISVNISVREALQGQGLYVEANQLPEGFSLATTADLAVTLDGLNIGSKQISLLFGVSTGARTAAFNDDITTLVNTLWSTLFGTVPMETTLQDALAGLISRKLNPYALAEQVEELVGRSLTRISDSVTLPSVIGNIELAAQGNCIAQYQVSLSAITAVPEFGQLASLAQAALSAAQDAALDFVVRTILSNFFSAIFEVSGEHFPSWDLKLSPASLEIPLSDLTDLDVRFIDPFMAGNRIGLVLRDLNSAGWSFGYDRAVNILLADPSNLAGSLELHSLGDWDTIRSVIFNEAGFLLVGGDRLREDNEFQESAVTLTDFLGQGLPSFELRGDDADGLRSAQELEVLKPTGTFAASTLSEEIEIFTSHGS